MVELEDSLVEEALEIISATTPNAVGSSRVESPVGKRGSVGDLWMNNLSRPSFADLINPQLNKMPRRGTEVLFSQTASKYASAKISRPYSSRSMR